VWNAANVPPAPPPKKSRKGIIIGCCGGCLVFMLVCCGLGGYVFYLEEGVSYNDPGDEIASVPLTSGNVAMEAAWNGTGYADLRVFVDLGEGAQSGARVTGTFGCTRDWAGVTGEMEVEPVDETYFPPYDGHPPEGWVAIPPRYNYRRASPTPVRCAGQLTLPPGTSNARLVMTARQRPSDYMSEWF
jgi:hypothetical protein